MILHTYLVVLFICFVTGISVRKSLSRALVYMLWLIIVTVPVEAIGYYFQEHKQRPPAWLFPSYQILECILLGWYFANLAVLLKYRNLILFAIPPVVVLNVVYLLDRAGYKILATYSFLLSAFLTTCWSMAYFFQLFKERDLQDPAHNPNFWICAGLLFFYAGTFFQMGFTNVIYDKNPDLAKELYVINHLLNCFLYGMITYGFICQSKYRK
jgi:hypothetical protein